MVAALSTAVAALDAVVAKAPISPSSSSGTVALHRPLLRVRGRKARDRRKVEPRFSCTMEAVRGGESGWALGGG